MENSNSPKTSVLKQIREQKGLTLEIVHEATKIPMDALKAIEEGYSVRLLSPFYYKGFIKIYAEFLGADVEEAWKQYGINQQPKITPASSKPAAKAAAVKSSQPNYVWENFKELLSNLFQPKNLKVLGRLIAIVVGIVLLLRVGGCIVDNIKNAPKKAPKRIVREQKKTEAPAPVATPAAEVSSDKVSAQAAMGRKVSLAVRAARDTWIQVKADGKTVFQSTMKKGTLENWTANDRIELSGKNINELDMEVNGKHIGPLGSAERRAKRVVITKEGLTVKK